MLEKKEKDITFESEKGQKKTTSNRQNIGKSWKHEVVCVPHMKMQNQGRGCRKK